MLTATISSSGVGAEPAKMEIASVLTASTNARRGVEDAADCEWDTLDHTTAVATNPGGRALPSIHRFDGRAGLSSGFGADSAQGWVLWNR